MYYTTILWQTATVFLQKANVFFLFIDFSPCFRYHFFILFLGGALCPLNLPIS